MRREFVVRTTITGRELMFDTCQVQHYSLILGTKGLEIIALNENNWNEFSAAENFYVMGKLSGSGSLTHQ